MKNIIKAVMLISIAAADFPSEDEQQEIVEMHREKGQFVEPPASISLLMDYDSELGNSVSELMANCSTNAPYLTSFRREDSMVFDEQSASSNPKYINAFDDYKRTTFCHHYMQVLYATSSVVGNARQHCADPLGSLKSTYLTACLTQPVEDRVDGRPHDSGPSCS
uniref:SCP domain-containing protein n=1 Tax=Mesocestoides corti TaxID=53468 RepID=A0A5K3FM10_MESCO